MTSVERSAGGRHRRQWDSSESMSESSKIKLRFCVRQFFCRRLLSTCYCCQTLPKFPLAGGNIKCAGTSAAKRCCF
ncbi:hypothetical protein PAHAL_1G085100 [Panicum hallii]|uniref:Uncharacterized protein n=1 Tax=Panicum hallii TaxID=206008 RepID=A0A2T8KUG8_9POAL|nr:hypothetical protein PAHAL_1G085100 [Panicum hallii]